MAACRCSSWCSRSIRSPPRCSARADIPKRLIPCTIALGAFTLHDGFAAGLAADPEHHPDDVLQDHDLGRAVARHDRRALFILVVGLAYIESRRRAAQARGEGYGTKLLQRAGAVRGREAAEPLDRAFAAGDRGRRELRADAARFRAPTGRPTRSRLARQADRHPDRRRGGDLGGGRRAAARHTDRVRVRLAAGARASSPTAARRRSPAPCWRR